MPLESKRETNSISSDLAHFDILDEATYIAWRKSKLLNYPESANDLIVAISDINSLSEEEHAAITVLLDKTNMCIYQAENPEPLNKIAIKSFAAKFGYTHLDTNICADEDGISSLQTRDSGRHVGYIPYSPRKLSWHTDGYYNKPENTIRGMLLHCINNAPTGGENQYLDPEILYIHLRNRNSEYIRSLMEPNALTIPANEEDGVERAAQTGPVFSLDNKTKSLHLRYTARTRSIEWAADPVLQETLDEIRDYLASDSPYIFRHKLKPGQGILCNNVLHNRTAFEENDTIESKRLIYRARFYDRQCSI